MVDSTAKMHVRTNVIRTLSVPTKTSNVIDIIATELPTIGFDPIATKTTVIRSSMVVRFVTTPVNKWTTSVNGPAKTLKNLTSGTTGTGVPNYAGMLG